MTLGGLKHRIKWDTRVGRLYRKGLMKVGLFLLNRGRACLRVSLGRCSWCGKYPGFASSVSKRGLRCVNAEYNCEGMPCGSIK